MFKKEEKIYKYQVTEEDLKTMGSFMAFLTFFTKNRSLYSPVKNLILEYQYIENYVVDKFIYQYPDVTSATIEVVGKYHMNIYLIKTDELKGYSFSSQIL